MKDSYNIAILGATGVVGRSMLSELEKSDISIGKLKLLASNRSAGRKIMFKGQAYEVEETSDDSFEGMDIVFGAAKNNIALRFIDSIRKSGALFIDNSSAFRLDDDVPLVVAGINDEDIFRHHGIVANPNCCTIIGLTAIAPIAKLSRIESMVISTYQAVSGAGEAGMTEYEEELKAVANNEPYEYHAFADQIVSNVIPNIGGLTENGYTVEEMKFQNEGRKIMHDDNLLVSCTCVRVPVLRSHSLSMTLNLEKEVSLDEVYESLKASPAIRMPEDREAMPLYVSEKTYVEVGRIRKDLVNPKGIAMWCAGDQILKGAAYNAVEIAKIYVRENSK